MDEDITIILEDMPLELLNEAADAHEEFNAMNYITNNARLYRRIRANQEAFRIICESLMYHNR